MANEHPNTRFQELSRKLLEGTISPMEEVELAQWLNEDDGEELKIPAAFADSKDAHRIRIWNEVSGKIRPKTLQKRFWVASAAAAVLLLAVVGYKLLNSSPAAGKRETKQIAQDHLPAGNRAVLTLGNGQRVALDSMAAGSQLGMAIKEDSGRLTYLHAATDIAQINSLTIPRGGRFTLTLSDGTLVWLNAASKLTYPTTFNGKERIVELEGQAYFEVAKDASRPFHVKAGKLNINVLGTSFDVMAYPDEKNVYTTLVEGSVQVQDNNTAKVLLPQQQAVADLKTGALLVQSVNTDKALAWKNGLFIFNNADFESLLREIARWYDVEFINLAGKNNELYGGSISRNKNLSDVLHLLGSYGSHQFKIEGRKVTILPK